jgi:hypothetical protein
MAGNELDIAKFLFENIGKLKLNHIGIVKEIGAPSSIGKYQAITDHAMLNLIATEDSSKKADIYINGIGVSLKQSGANFPFNRLQRAELLEVFKVAGFESPEAKLERIDKEVHDFHNEIIQGRSRPWQNLFNETDFKRLVEFLMMQGSPNLGYSKYPAELILEAPKYGINENNIEVFSFDEYFDWFKQDLYFAIRRQWIGQSSNSEHGRAVGLAKKEGNKKWVYENIKGEPRISATTGKRWRDDVLEKDRRTVYLIFVEKVG